MPKLLLLGLLLHLATSTSFIRAQDVLPYRHAALEVALSDDHPWRQFLSRLERGEARLDCSDPVFALELFLRELSIPVESQVLVFSKSSVQQRLVSPRSPRALYWSPEIVVGYVPGSSQWEVLVEDPHRGSEFFVATIGPDGLQVRAGDRCVTCHASRKTHGMPGWLLSSLAVDEAGQPFAGFEQPAMQLPIEQRWGGWYVTGSTPQQPHRGNLIGRAAFDQHELTPLLPGALEKLPETVNRDQYPVATSDVVSLLLLEHYAEGYNLLHRASAEYRLGRPLTRLDELVRHLLCADPSSTLKGPIDGILTFLNHWTDDAGIILNDKDLETRLFRWQISPLVGTPSFQRLPLGLRLLIEERQEDCLNGAAEWPSPDVPSHEQRRESLAIWQSQRSRP